MDGLVERQLGDVVHPAETWEVWLAYASFQHKIKGIYLSCPQQWEGRVMVWFNPAHLSLPVAPRSCERQPQLAQRCMPLTRHGHRQHCPLLLHLHQPKRRIGDEMKIEMRGGEIRGNKKKALIFLVQHLLLEYPGGGAFTRRSKYIHGVPLLDGCSLP